MTAGFCAAPRHAEPPEAEPSAWLCKGCRLGLLRDLRLLPAQYADLGHAGGRGDGGDGDGLPFSEPASAHRDHIRALAVSWALAVAEEGYRGEFPADGVASVCAYLRGAVRWCSFRRWSADMATEFGAACARAQALLDPFVTARFTIPGADGLCLWCTGAQLRATVYKSQGDRRWSFLSCPGCGARWELDEWQQLDRDVAARRKMAG